jgi:hypothetical protein
MYKIDDTASEMISIRVGSEETVEHKKNLDPEKL